MIIIARFLVRAGNSRVLLMDEPFNAIDTGIKGKVMSEFRKIMDGPDKAFLIITHTDLESLRDITKDMDVKEYHMKNGCLTPARIGSDCRV